MSAPDPSRDATRFLRLVNALDHSIVWEFDDTEQCYTFVSDHSNLVLGYDSDAWMADASRFETCIEAEDLPAFLELLAKLRRGEGNDLRVEHRCKRADGSVVWLHTGVHCVYEEGHRILRGVSVEIHNVKQAEERERKARQQVEEAIRHLEEVLAIVSHDVRDPLNAMLAGIRMLEAQPKSIEKSTAVIAKSGQRLASLLDDLNDLSSIRARRLSMDATETTTDALVRDAFDSFESRAVASSIELVLVDPPSVTIRCDAKRIAQVLGNLLGNALKFTPAGGRVTLAVEVDPLEASFHVLDTGPGMDAEMRARAFDRDWQAPATAHKGRGLGLFISKGIVEAHAGRVWIESVPGAGAAFFFTIPIAPTPDEGDSPGLSRSS